MAVFKHLIVVNSCLTYLVSLVATRVRAIVIENCSIEGGRTRKSVSCSDIVDYIKVLLNPLDHRHVATSTLILNYLVAPDLHVVIGVGLFQPKSGRGISEAYKIQV